MSAAPRGKAAPGAGPSRLIAEALRTAGTDAIEHAERIATVLAVMADAGGPLKGADPRTNTGGGRSSDTSDPTGRDALGGRRDAVRTDLRRVDTIARDLLQLTRQLGAILDRYDPTDRQVAELRAEVTGSRMGKAIWCENHLEHGHEEPREQGRTVCKWCRNVKEAHGRYPNRAAIDAHYRRPRLGPTEIRRLLRKGDG